MPSRRIPNLCKESYLSNAVTLQTYFLNNSQCLPIDEFQGRREDVSAETLFGSNLSSVGTNVRNLTQKRLVYRESLAKIAGKTGPRRAGLLPSLPHNSFCYLEMLNVHFVSCLKNR